MVDDQLREVRQLVFGQVLEDAAGDVLDLVRRGDRQVRFLQDETVDVAVDQ
jgi:hypothetical protein